MRSPSPAKPDWSRPASPRPRRRWAATPIVGLLHASDAGADGVAKLAGALRRREDADEIAVIQAFTTAQLDLALGRSNVVHAALLAGPANDTFLARFARLERFRTGGTGQAAPGRERN